MNKNDNTFLARWISNELTEVELIEFKASKIYKEFKLINEEAQFL